jgi:hypothetical protein
LPGQGYNSFIGTKPKNGTEPESSVETKTGPETETKTEAADCSGF